MANDDLLRSTDSGLYCAAGDFYIDPWKPVPRALITHAHGDHARPGSDRYLTASEGQIVLQARLGPDATIDVIGYGESVAIGGVRVSFHPAGHVLGSAQIRIERCGEVWVASGDYKLADDRTCSTFEPQPCDVFITESTFGLPIYRWPDEQAVFADINAWWQTNADEGRASVVFAYSLGKAQRVLAGIEASIGPIFCHGAVQRMNEMYRYSGVAVPPTEHAGAIGARRDWAGSLVVAPPSARGSPWMRRFGELSTAFVSGWMQIRGARRRRSVDRGFTISDHADWPHLAEAIRATGARRVLVTHGYTATMVRWLTEQGYDAAPLATQFEGEQDEVPEAPSSEDDASMPASAPSSGEAERRSEEKS